MSDRIDRELSPLEVRLLQQVTKAVKDIPILFSPVMVRALDYKTQTRRTRGLERINEAPDDWKLEVFDAATGAARFHHKAYREVIDTKCPYGVSGDRLWVREFIRFIDDDKGFRWIYGADGAECYTPHEGALNYKSYPAIHMPRWASRYTLLRTTDRAPERVRDISGMDAKSEGVSIPAHMPMDGADLDWARREFKALWDSINEKRGLGWNVNPWVWPINFKVVPRG
jgi:hypothetical protein